MMSLIAAQPRSENLCQFLLQVDFTMNMKLPQHFFIISVKILHM